MSNINNQTKDLYSIELVQDLDHEAAATVSGGALGLYEQAAPGGPYEIQTAADPNLEVVEDEAAYYALTGNKTWYAYTGKNYTGQGYALKPTGGKKVPLPAGAQGEISSVLPA